MWQNESFLTQNDRVALNNCKLLTQIVHEVKVTASFCLLKAKNTQYQLIYQRSAGGSGKRNAILSIVTEDVYFRVQTPLGIYKNIGKLFICVVADQTKVKSGYIITAYLTHRIKEGEQVYVKN